ncbi:hypothetical protein [Methanosarcina sp.]|uniref:hypothetical protein n=1 Tax=Methanosarcina sp. TaxID=2213 RepID=UPI002AB88678|nr:hypothetical protein [Methanosarcina sp.]MDY9924920.1 hypothetical protein [Methanosarcina sp.]
MKAKSLSSVTRSIDLTYPTNRAITVVTLLFFFVTAGFQFASGKDVFPALYSGLRAGISVFFAWAFAREIDPDNELSAFVAAFTGCIGFIFFSSPLLLALLLELMIIRIVNRSKGLPARTLDSLVVLLLSSWILLQGGWVFCVLAFLAFVLDAFLPEPNRSPQVFAGALFLALSLSVRFLFFSGNEREKVIIQGTGLPIFILTAILLFIPLIFNSRTITSKGDLTGIPLSPLRVQTAQMMALLSIVLPAVLQGWSGVESLIPLWGAVFGVSIYGNSKLLFKKLIMVLVRQR